MDRYLGANDVDALVLYLASMKSMTVDNSHVDVSRLFSCAHIYYSSLRSNIVYSTVILTLSFHTFLSVSVNFYGAVHPVRML